jgi:hypothetical protein
MGLSEQLIHIIKEWVKMDNDIKKLQKEIRKIKEQNINQIKKL